MLSLTLDQLNTIRKEMFFQKLCGFLINRTKRENLRERLFDRSTWDLLWNTIFLSMNETNEYQCAIILSFAIICDCEGINPFQALAKINKLDDKEYIMKSFMADKGYLRFSEFDL